MPRKLGFVNNRICWATMLNLSLLTSDVWAVLIRIFAYHEKVDWIYLVVFAGTAAGLVIYSYKSSKEAEETAHVAGASDELGKEWDEEAGMQNPARNTGVGDGGPISNELSSNVK